MTIQRCSQCPSSAKHEDGTTCKITGTYQAHSEYFLPDDCPLPESSELVFSVDTPRTWSEKYLIR